MKQVRINTLEFRKKLGLKFSARILALHTALNKINALMDLLWLNNEYVKNDKPARSQRNFNIALMLSFGILYELYERINDIMEGPMKIVKKDPELRDHIDKILKLFNGKEYISLLEAYRNQMSFHIDICNVKSGLEINVKDTVDFLISDSSREIDEYYKFPEEALTNGFFKRNELKFAKLINSNNPPSFLTDEMKHQALKKLVDYLHDVHVKIGPAIEGLFIFLIEKYKLAANIKDS